MRHQVQTPVHREPGSTDSDTETAISRALLARIRTAIAQSDGLLPFDRFMELALYAPGLGYYVAGAHKFGPSGDFVTAPEISPLFGRCLAAQCAEVLERLGGGDIFEIGAGSGALATHILAQLDTLGSLPERYRILEPSPDLQERQHARLSAALPRLAERCEWLSDFPADLRGVVIANEVLDAMPVQRFRIGPDGEILEVFVTDQAGTLVEITAPPRSAGLHAAVAALMESGFVQTPGYDSEINPRLAPWLTGLSESLSAGLVLLVDYGYPRSAYYQPDRSMGTLMCHRRHQSSGDPYRDLGLQDITAHVDFTAVAEGALDAGFTLEGFTTQTHFLIGCGIDQIMLHETQTDTLDLALGAKQLLLPSAMGERFKVIGLSKGVAGPWRGFSVRDLSDRL